MIGIMNMLMPKKCIWCPVRWNCKRYRRWLYSGGLASPNPMPGTDECRLIDLSRYDDDLK